MRTEPDVNHSAVPYPEGRAARNEWVARLREAPEPVDVLRPNGFLIERERAASGGLIESICIFLTNRECPWRCVMCDLWRHTIAQPTPEGAIPAQIDAALRALETDEPSAALAQQIKLYNSGSFFDAAAVPPADHPAIVAHVRRFERVVVECHPALVHPRVPRFAQLLSGQLEVAMGLESIHPEVLPKLNKGMNLDQFQRAAEVLDRHAIGLRVFVLIQPPWLTEPEAAIEWSVKSAGFAFDCGATAVSLIPTRPGPGALATLARQGFFRPPTLATIEEALAGSLALKQGRVFVDLWELEQFASCSLCFPARRGRLQVINENQQSAARIHCAACGGL